MIDDSHGLDFKRNLTLRDNFALTKTSLKVKFDCINALFIRDLLHNTKKWFHDVILVVMILDFVYQTM